MKYRWFTAIAVALIWTTSAGIPAEEEAINTDFEKLTIEYGEFEMDLDGYIKRLSKGVKMKFMKFFDKPSEDDLDIQAQTVNFKYLDAEDKIPDLIVFETDVVFSHPKGSVRADRATVNLQKRQAVLTGNPVANWPPVQGWEAEYFEIDLELGQLIAGRGIVKEFDLRDVDIEADTTDANEPG